MGGAAAKGEARCSYGTAAPTLGRFTCIWACQNFCGGIKRARLCHWLLLLLLLPILTATALSYNRCGRSRRTRCSRSCAAGSGRRSSGSGC